MTMADHPAWNQSRLPGLGPSHVDSAAFDRKAAYKAIVSSSTLPDLLKRESSLLSGEYSHAIPRLRRPLTPCWLLPRQRSASWTERGSRLFTITIMS